MKKFAALLLLAAATASPGFAQKAAPAALSKISEVLLIGTFHFHNPGADVAKFKTFDILAPKAQAELDAMATKIAAFHPTKLFVEWPYNEQPELDSLYQAYLGPDYARYVRTRYPKRPAFYLKNEIVQLAFRAGKKAKASRVYALDYGQTNFPFDSVKQAMQQAGQQPLLQKMADTFKRIETSTNQKLATYSLTALLLDFNLPANLKANKGTYLDIFNRAGRPDNFAGAYLVSEWYRRNLYMYSLVQKTLGTNGERAMVLVGAGHAAMLREFIALDSQLRLVELKTVLKN